MKLREPVTRDTSKRHRLITGVGQHHCISSLQFFVALNTTLHANNSCIHNQSNRVQVYSYIGFADLHSFLPKKNLQTDLDEVSTTVTGI